MLGTSSHLGRRQLWRLWYILGLLVAPVWSCFACHLLLDTFLNFPIVLTLRIDVHIFVGRDRINQCIYDRNWKFCECILAIV